MTFRIGQMISASRRIRQLRSTRRSTEMFHDPLFDPHLLDDQPEVDVTVKDRDDASREKDRVAKRFRQTEQAVITERADRKIFRIGFRVRTEHFFLS